MPNERTLRRRSIPLTRLYLTFRDNRATFSGRRLIARTLVARVRPTAILSAESFTFWLTQVEKPTMHHTSWNNLHLRAPPTCLQSLGCNSFFRTLRCYASFHPPHSRFQADTENKTSNDIDSDVVSLFIHDCDFRLASWVPNGCFLHFLPHHGDLPSKLGE